MGCSHKAPPRGALITMKYENYRFVNNSFVDQEMDCIFLGGIDKGKEPYIYYCAGRNYAHQLMEGYVFENFYDVFNDRMIGAKLKLEGDNKKPLTIPCVSHALNERATEGKEFTVCMIAYQEKFNLYGYIRTSNSVKGTLSAAIGTKEVHKGEVSKEGKKLLEYFYKNVSLKHKKDPKSKDLWTIKKL